jgi:RNA polymerase sigma-70 factor (ECF subfamily)
MSAGWCLFQTGPPAGGNISGPGRYYPAVDWASFEAEAMPHAPRLFRLAMWLERNRHEAEDLVQETFVQALQAFHRFTPGTNCRAWLITILHHVRSNRIRARQRRPVIEDVDDRIAETVPFVPAIPDHLTDEEILDALGSIPEANQHVVLLCDVEGLSYKEIAEALAIPMGTVMSRLHRGRALLRQRLAGAGGRDIFTRRPVFQKGTP